MFIPVSYAFYMWDCRVIFWQLDSDHTMISFEEFPPTYFVSYIRANLCKCFLGNKIECYLLELRYQNCQCSLLYVRFNCSFSFFFSKSWNNQNAWLIVLGELYGRTSIYVTNLIILLYALICLDLEYYNGKVNLGSFACWRHLCKLGKTPIIDLYYWIILSPMCEHWRTLAHMIFDRCFSILL